MPTRVSISSARLRLSAGDRPAWSWNRRATCAPTVIRGLSEVRGVCDPQDDDVGVGVPRLVLDEEAAGLRRVLHRQDAGLRVEALADPLHEVERLDQHVGADPQAARVMVGDLEVLSLLGICPFPGHAARSRGENSGASRQTTTRLSLSAVMPSLSA